MRVLVTGATGFLGSRIVAALRAAGHEVVSAVRNPAAFNGPAIACDFACDIGVETWKPRLTSVDAVINCAGILRETHMDTFQCVHVDAPLALFRACVACGVRRVVQLSALGEPQDGEFIASKHRGDAALAQLDLDWLVLRPGLVYSAHGAYGGTSMLRALAALPGILPLPRDGRQQLRPLAAEDLARAMVAALAHPQLRGQVLELVGPEILMLRDYLLAWRRWFGLRAPIMIRTPQPFVTLAIALGEWWGRGPLCRVIGNLLERRRIGADDALARMQTELGLIPASLGASLSERPSDECDMWQARWYTLRPLLLFSLALVWIVSGVVGFVLPDALAAATLPQCSPALVRDIAYFTAMLNFALGAALLAGWRVGVVLKMMLAMVLVYTMTIGIAAPAHWLDPFGGLLKNLPIIAVLITLLALEPRR